MPHVFVKPSLVVQTAVEILQRQRVLQALVTTDGLGDFGGSNNDTINIRVPAIAGAHTRTLRASDRTLQTDDLVEYSIPVQLTEHVYSAIKLTDEQRTLDINDFARQVVMPQVSAMAYKLEDLVADLVDSPSYDEVLAIDPYDTFPGFIDARKKLNDANVPDQNRILVVGSAVEASILKDDQFRKHQESGDSNALRRAYLGDIAGMRVFRSNAIASDTAYEWHPTAFVYVNRAPKASEGVVASASYAADNVALRWLADWSYSEIGLRSLVDVFTGYKVITEANGDFVRGVKLRLSITDIDIVGGDFGVTAAAGASHTKQLKVVDTNGQDVTADCDFDSATPAKATVSASGLVTGVAAGTSVITATYADPNGGAAHTDTVTATAS
jgi:hypothetical protein